MGCAKLCGRIVRQSKDNVSQRKIANNLGLSPSTVHNIVKRFREPGEISVRKGQWWLPLLNARDLRALRRYCLRNCHATMMDIVTWAQEYFGKSLSLNTVRCSIKKCNLKWYYAKGLAFITFVQKSCQVLWAQSHLWWAERPLVSGQTRHISACFWEKRTSDYTCQRLMQRLMLEFWRDIRCRQDNDFSQVLHVYFSKTMPALILHELQQRAFVGIESVCLTGLPAIQIENVCFMKRRIR